MDGFLCYKFDEVIFKYVVDENLFSDFDFSKLGRFVSKLLCNRTTAKLPPVPCLYKGFWITYLQRKEVVLLALIQRSNFNVLEILGALEKMSEIILINPICDTIDLNRCYMLLLEIYFKSANLRNGSGNDDFRNSIAGIPHHET